MIGEYFKLISTKSNRKSCLPVNQPDLMDSVLCSFFSSLRMFLKTSTMDVTESLSKLLLPLLRSTAFGYFAFTKLLYSGLSFKSTLYPCKKTLLEALDPERVFQAKSLNIFVEMFHHESGFLESMIPPSANYSGSMWKNKHYGILEFHVIVVIIIGNV